MLVAVVSQPLSTAASWCSAVKDRLWRVGLVLGVPAFDGVRAALPDRVVALFGVVMHCCVSVLHCDSRA